MRHALDSINGDIDAIRSQKSILMDGKWVANCLLTPSVFKCLATDGINIDSSSTDDGQIVRLGSEKGVCYFFCQSSEKD